MKSPVKEKLMQVLLDGEAHTLTELTRKMGFTKGATIQRWITSFENARFIVRTPAEKGEDREYQLIVSKDAVRRIYYYPEFRRIRPLIRKAPWFGPLFTEKFSALPGNLPQIVNEMVKKSHSFFEIVDTYDTPEKVREVYGPCLFVNALQGISHEEFNIWCLYYQLYVQCIVRDLPGGGLDEGFMDLVREVQVHLSDLYRRRKLSGGIHRGV